MRALRRLAGVLALAGALLIVGCRTLNRLPTPVPTPAVTLPVLPPLTDPLPTNEPPTPLTVTLAIPTETTPGATVTLRLRVSNRSAGDQSQVRVVLPLPDGWQPAALPPGVSFADGQIALTIETLKAGASYTRAFFLRAPLALGVVELPAVRVTADGAPPVRAAPVNIEVVGGRVSPGVARALGAGDVAVEGRVAHVGSNFFYLQDAADGLRVVLADARGQVTVGDSVLISGTLARAAADALTSFPLPIGTVQLTAAQPPLIVTPAEDAVDPLLPVALAADGQLSVYNQRGFGRLMTAEGTLYAVERLPHGLALDMQTTTGEWRYAVLPGAPQTVGALADALTVGSTLRVTGILDAFGVSQILLRSAEDVQRLYPPGLRVSLSAPGNVLPGGSVTHTLVITNDGDAELANVVVAASVPRGSPQTVPAELLSYTPGGNLGSDQVLYFGIGRLAASGSHVLTYTLYYPAAGLATVAASARTADASLSASATHELYVGSSVPLAALQGDGAQSPFAGRQVVVEGIVSGVFPELGGFFMQTPALTVTTPVTATPLVTATVTPTPTVVLTPTQPAAPEPALTPTPTFTPTGLFVSVAAPEIVAGTAVTVSGVVREVGGQTTLLGSPDNVAIRAIGEPLPRPHPYDPPLIGAVDRYNERLEGVLLAVAEPAVAIAPTDAQGETLLIYTRHDQMARPAWDGPVIALDDGARVTRTLATLPYSLARGDSVAAVVGPLSQIDGRYRLQPLIAPIVAPGVPLTGSVPITPSTPVTDQVTIATWYADVLPPSLPAGLSAANVIGLQGAAAEAAEALAGATYRVVRVTGSPLAMLVQTGTLTVTGALTLTPPNITLIRPPLMLTATVGTHVLQLVNVELTRQVGGANASARWRGAEMAAIMGALTERRSADATAVLLVAMHDGSESTAYSRLVEYNSYRPMLPPTTYTTFRNGFPLDAEHIFVSAPLPPAVRSAVALTDVADRPAATAHAPLVVTLDLRR